jgi:hypothetical protein
MDTTPGGNYRLDLRSDGDRTGWTETPAPIFTELHIPVPYIRAVQLQPTGGPHNLRTRLRNARVYMKRGGGED